jgi:hypothetical protein
MMKRRAVRIEVSDHAVIRWLENAHGLDVRAVRRHIADKVRNGAQLEAAAVVIDQVRFVLRDREDIPAGHLPKVTVTTTLETNERRGVGSNNGRRVRPGARPDD